MFRTLMTALGLPPRRAADDEPTARFAHVGPTPLIEEGVQILPRRTPGLATARRHTWTGVHHSLGALRAVSEWADVRHDPTCGSEADVLYVAACHQLDAAGTALAAAREALAAIARKGRR
ncbi:hypothetical protein ACF07Q_28725 [Nocardiopsis dassonvillei]|uniref:hypothetical protein n=1 Tax=Nocardiopsis dassonvillei TaxID=2014 RepID=UPI0036FEBBF4